jgi:hypothetical protein
VATEIFDESVGHLSLSLDELAILEMTNDPNLDRELFRPVVRPAGLRKLPNARSVVFTTKDSYFWAVLISVLLENRRADYAEQLLETVFSAAIRQRKQLALAYNSLSFPTGHPGFVSSASWPIFEEASRHLGFPVEQLVERTDLAYRELVRAQLIEDPLEVFVLGGLAISALGLVPIGWTRKTKKGKIVSQKVHALFWRYEKSEINGIETKSIEIQLFRILQAFKAGATGAFKSALQLEEKGPSRLAQKSED